MSYHQRMMHPPDMNLDQTPTPSSPLYSGSLHDTPFHPANAFVMGAISHILLNTHDRSGVTSDAHSVTFTQPDFQHTLHHGVKGGVALASAALIGNALGRGHDTSGIVSFAGGLLTMTLLDNLLSNKSENNKTFK